MRARVTEQDGIYTASIPIPLSKGQELVIEGHASIGETLSEAGLDQGEAAELASYIRPENVSGYGEELVYVDDDIDFEEFYVDVGFGRQISKAVSRAMRRRAVSDAKARKALRVLCQHFKARRGQPEVGIWPFKQIGRLVKKVTSSKAVKKALGVVKDVVKSPITTAALGVVTGGASVPFTAAASGAIRLAEQAAKGGKAAAAAARLLKASARTAKPAPPRTPAYRAKQQAIYKKMALARLQGKKFPPFMSSQYKSAIARYAAAAKRAPRPAAARPVVRPTTPRYTPRALPSRPATYGTQRHVVTVYFK
ncbi:MAG: hypothetical protein JSV86_18260 [Gemmatimonadota bacterium]|nr:MAG: hypothetical protein JSV86_18260 [Gemmatimonadota bacterium]